MFDLIMAILNVVWITIGIVAFAGVVWWLWGDEKRYAHKANSWATEHEWDFIGEDDSWEAPFTRVPFKHRFENVSNKIMTGTFNGVHVFVGEHRASEFGKKDVQSFPWAMMKVPKTWSQTSISPRNHSLPDAAFPSDSIDFEWGEFNESWNVRSEDSRFVHTLITGRMLELLQTGFKKRTVVLHEGWLMVTTRNPISAKPGVVKAMEKISTVSGAKPANDEAYYDDYTEFVTGLAADLTKLVELAPSHLWVDHGGVKPTVTDAGVEPLVDDDDDEDFE